MDPAQGTLAAACTGSRRDRTCPTGWGRKRRCTSAGSPPAPACPPRSRSGAPSRSVTAPRSPPAGRWPGPRPPTAWLRRPRRPDPERRGRAPVPAWGATSLTLLENSRIEPVALAVAQGLQLEGERALGLLHPALRRGACFLDDEILAEPVLASLPAGETDRDGRHGIEPRTFLVGHIVERIEARCRPPGIRELAEAQRHHAAEIEGVIRQVLALVVQVEIGVVGILCRDAA